MTTEIKKRGRPSKVDKVEIVLTRAQAIKDYNKERKGKEALEEGKVLLYGLHKIKSDILKDYEDDYKPPKTFKISKTIGKVKLDTNETKEKKEKRVFNANEEYTVEDLIFLKKVYDSISKKLIDYKSLSDDEYDKLEEDQSIIYDLIENLDKIKGSGIKEQPQVKESKAKSVIKQETKQRMVKGSPEAIEWGKKLSLAKKAKQGYVEPIVEIKIKKDKRLPYYYIGKIPLGYREATEEEAIINNFVGFWGKYKVDSLKYHKFNLFGDILKDDIDKITIVPAILGLKKRISFLLKDIEIYKNKIESPKHIANLGKNEELLSNAFKQLEYVKFMLDHYTNLYKKKYIQPEPVKPIIDNQKYIFRADGKNDLVMNKTHFNKDFILKPKTAAKLYEQNIRLEPKFYSEDDKKQYFYKTVSKLEGRSINFKTLFKPIGGVFKDILETFNKYDSEFKDFPISVQRVIKELGNKPIQQIKITRTPLSTIQTAILNGLSLGQFNKNMKELGYDKLFHLRIDMMINNKWAIIEKNEILNATTYDTRVPDKSEQIDITNIPEGITLIDALRSVRKLLGPKLFTYSAQHNNCQDFVIAFLKASNIGSQEDYDFIKQNTNELFNKMSNVSKLTDKVIGEVANIEQNIAGLGIPDNVQSIVFDKKIFSLNQAVNKTS